MSGPNDECCGRPAAWLVQEPGLRDRWMCADCAMEALRAGDETVGGPPVVRDERGGLRHVIGPDGWLREMGQ